MRQGDRETGRQGIGSSLSFALLTFLVSQSPLLFSSSPCLLLMPSADRTETVALRRQILHVNLRFVRRAVQVERHLNMTQCRDWRVGCDPFGFPSVVDHA